MNTSKITVRRLAVIGVLSAAAFLLQLLGTVLPFKVGGFLEIEFSDLPAIIGTFAMGPVTGVVIELIKNLLKCSMTTTGFVGELANFLINGTFVLTAGLIYNRSKTRKGAVIGLCCAVITMTVMGMLANYFILLPLYMQGASFEVKMNLILTTITPFNLVKGAVLSLITFFIYKPLSPIIKGR